MNALDWFARVLLLALAGSATLAIVAAIGAVPAGSGLGIAGSNKDRRAIVAPAESPPRRQAEVAPTDSVPLSFGRDRPMSAGDQFPFDQDRAWLRPLTYAVMALAGFVAAILVALLRLSAQLAEIARRLSN